MTGHSVIRHLALSPCPGMRGLSGPQTGRKHPIIISREIRRCVLTLKYLMIDTNKYLLSSPGPRPSPSPNRPQEEEVEFYRARNIVDRYAKAKSSLMKLVTLMVYNKVK